MYTEINREEVAVSLYIKRLSDEDAGEYLCTALYAGNLKMTASVSVSVFRKLRVHNILKKSINLSEWRNQARKPKLTWKTWSLKLKVIVFQLELRGWTLLWRSSLRLTQILNWDAKFKRIRQPTSTGWRNLWSYRAVSSSCYSATKTLHLSSPIVCTVVHRFYTPFYPSSTALCFNILYLIFKVDGQKERSVKMIKEMPNFGKKSM